MKRISPTCPLLVNRIRNPAGRDYVADQEEDLCAAFGERLGQKPIRATCRNRDGDAQTIKTTPSTKLGSYLGCDRLHH